MNNVPPQSTPDNVCFGTGKKQQKQMLTQRTLKLKLFITDTNKDNTFNLRVTLCEIYDV